MVQFQHERVLQVGHCLECACMSTSTTACFTWQHLEEFLASLSWQQQTLLLAQAYSCVSAILQSNYE